MKKQPLDEDALEAFVRQHEHEIRRFYSGDPLDRVKEIVDHYHNAATRSLFHVEQFKSELLTGLRALSMVASSVGDAATHNEKNARLRGLTSIIESTYEQVSKYDIEISRYSWAWDDVFKSNYPVRNYLHQIEELQAEVARLNAERESGQEGAGDGGDL